MKPGTPSADPATPMSAAAPPPTQAVGHGPPGAGGGPPPPGGGGHGHHGQHYSLRWNNHQSHVLSAFDDLLQNEALVDCTLVCEDTNIKAHKVVLSACR